eukprot:scaffold16496_cov56-Phaeocystis_antarctica.AAC.1
MGTGTAGWSGGPTASLRRRDKRASRRVVRRRFETQGRTGACRVLTGSGTAGARNAAAAASASTGGGAACARSAAAVAPASTGGGAAPARSAAGKTSASTGGYAANAKT